MQYVILGNPGVTHSVPTAFIILGKPGVTHSVPTAFIILGNPGMTHSVPTAFMNAVDTKLVTPGLCMYSCIFIYASYIVTIIII